MRAFTAILAAAGSLALAASLSTPAHAATGVFTYSYKDQLGQQHTGKIINSPSRKCVNLPVSLGSQAVSGFAPVNGTNATVIMFTHVGCEGQHYSLKPGGKASDRLLLRSIVFT
jgi:hypothetical protein